MAEIPGDIALTNRPPPSQQSLELECLLGVYWNGFPGSKGYERKCRIYQVQCQRPSRLRRISPRFTFLVFHFHSINSFRCWIYLPPARQKAALIEWLNSIHPDSGLPMQASDEQLRAFLLDGSVFFHILRKLRPNEVNWHFHSPYIIVLNVVQLLDIIIHLYADFFLHFRPTRHWCLYQNMSESS